MLLAGLSADPGSPASKGRSMSRTDTPCDHVTTLFHSMMNLCGHVALVSARARWTDWMWRANAARYTVEARQGTLRFASTKATAPAPSHSTAAVANGSQTSPSSAAPASSSVPSPSHNSSSSSSPSVRRICITIHGYLGVPRPFLLWRGPLTAAGYHLEDYAYDSGGTMEEIARGLNVFIEDTIRQHMNRGESALEFEMICHSMGGLVLRYAMNSGEFPIPVRGAPSASGSSSSPRSSRAHTSQKLIVGRIVMIATPNQGSEYARSLAKYPKLKKIVLGFAKWRVPGATWLRGIRTDLLTKLEQQQQQESSRIKPSAAPSAAETVSAAASGGESELLACGDVLMTHPASWFRTHMPLPRELYQRTLIIAGTMSLLHGVAPQPSDGTIQFEETKLPEPVTREGDEPIPQFQPRSTDSPVSAGPAGSQHMSFHAQHSFLLAHPGVIDAVLRFLQTGRAD